MTLTEQWKKGKLEDGRYYFRHKDNSTPFAWFGSKKVYDGYSNDEVVEVLTPVPSYEELEELKIDNHNLNAWIKNFQPKYKEIEKENQQLKWLLLECREWIEFLSVKMKAEKSPKNAMYFEVMLTKIDNAIGEKK